MQGTQNCFSISELCQALGVSRSGYYKNKNKTLSIREQENSKIIETIKEIRKERFKAAYGSPRMTVELRKRGFSASENRVARLMRKAGIKARHKRVFRPKTTVHNSDRRLAPNRLAQAPTPSRCAEILVNDITYVATRQGWLYLAMTMDLFSRKILGWHLSNSTEPTLVVEAAQKALRKSEVGSGTIYHSDRGCQYSSSKMKSWLKEQGMLPSMGAKGYCYDNAAAESFFASLKREAFPQGCVFDTEREARLTIFEYIEAFYNRERIHTSLGNSSPKAFLKNHSTTKTTKQQN